MKLPELHNFVDAFNDPLWLMVAKLLCNRHNLAFTELCRAEHGENIVFLVDGKYIVKIYMPQKNGFAREKAAIEFVTGKTSLKIAKIVAEGEIEGFKYLITTLLEGDLMTREVWIGLETRHQVFLLNQLAIGLNELHSLPSHQITFDWPAFLARQVETVMERQTREGGNPEWLESLPKFLESNLGLLPADARPVFMHGDVHFGNLRVANIDGKWQITGIFDFADSLKGFHEYDFIAIGVLMVQGQGDLQREFFRSYGYPGRDIDETLRRRMMLLTTLYEHSSLRRYAERRGPHAKALTLDQLERAIWSFV